MTVRLTKQEVYDLLEHDDCVEVETEKWRHGTRVTHVAPFQGQLVRFEVEYHTYEGIQFCGDTEGEIVKAVTKTVVDYVPVEG